MNRELSCARQAFRCDSAHGSFHGRRYWSLLAFVALVRDRFTVGDLAQRLEMPESRVIKAADRCRSVLFPERRDFPGIRAIRQEPELLDRVIKILCEKRGWPRPTRQSTTYLIRARAAHLRRRRIGEMMMEDT